MRRLIVLGMSGFLAVAWCARRAAAAGLLTLPPEVRSISVHAVDNQTDATATDKLKLDIEDGLVKDGRVAFVRDEDQADAVLMPTVRYFQSIPLSLNASGLPSLLQAWVVLDVVLMNRKTGRAVWEEPAFQIKRQYRPDTEPGGESEEQLEESIWKKLGDDVVQRTLEGPSDIDSLTQRALPANLPKRP